MRILITQDYKRLNFNDTSSHEQYVMHTWSNFSYETIMINGVRFQEINLSGTANPKITWSTNPPVAICSFRHNTQEKSLHIFNTKTKKFLDFRANEGRLYFKECLDLFKNAYNIK